MLAGNGVLETSALPKLILLVSELAQSYCSISPRHNIVQLSDTTSRSQKDVLR